MAPYGQTPFTHARLLSRTVVEQHKTHGWNPEWHHTPAADKLASEPRVLHFTRSADAPISRRAYVKESGRFIANACWREITAEDLELCRDSENNRSWSGVEKELRCIIQHRTESISPTEALSCVLSLKNINHLVSFSAASLTVLTHFIWTASRREQTQEWLLPLRYFLVGGGWKQKTFTLTVKVKSFKLCDTYCHTILFNTQFEMLSIK